MATQEELALLRAKLDAIRLLTIEAREIASKLGIPVFNGDDGLKLDEWVESAGGWESSNCW